MSDSPPERRVRPYRPFPSFDEWAQVSSVSPLVDRFVDRFTAFREHSADDGAAMRERATRWAAIDTGAIENLYDVDRGFTISLAASVALLQAIAELKGEAVERAVADALAAYEFVLDLATQRTEITEVSIRDLHTIACRTQETYRVLTAVGPQDQTMPKGVYKTQDNHPLNLASNEVHAYAPVTDTPGEMARLVAELRSPPFLAAHPVQQAAYAHFAFVAIHPFADGNGRVSRALASVFLYRDPGLPLVVFSDEKPGYLAALEAADEGRYQAFTSFVGDRLIDTINLLADDGGPQLPSVAEQAAEFARELSGRGGRSHDEVDDGARRLLETFERVLRYVIVAAGIDAPFSATVAPTGVSWSVQTEGFRPAPGAAFPVLQVTSDSPAAASTQLTLGVLVAKGLDGDVDYLLASSSGDRLEVFLREVLPTVSHSLELRLRTFAERMVRATLLRVTDAARRTLRDNGYT